MTCRSSKTATMPKFIGVISQVSDDYKRITLKDPYFTKIYDNEQDVEKEIYEYMWGEFEQNLDKDGKPHNFVAKQIDSLPSDAIVWNEGNGCWDLNEKYSFEQRFDWFYDISTIGEFVDRTWTYSVESFD